MKIRYLLLLLVVASPVIFQLGQWAAAIVLAVVRGRKARCPRCNAGQTRRSNLTITDRFLPFFVVARRCENCWYRFYCGQSVNYVQRAKASRGRVSASAHGAAGMFAATAHGPSRQ